jgi:hypothetical protein
MDSEIRASLEQIIRLDDKLCARGTRLLRAVASEAEDALALLRAAGEPAVGRLIPSRDILAGATLAPTRNVAAAPMRLSASCIAACWPISLAVIGVGCCFHCRPQCRGRKPDGRAPNGAVGHNDTIGRGNAGIRLGSHRARTVAA